MKVAYLVPPHNAQCLHDFGCSFLLHGLRSVLGPENVLDFPEAESLHRTPNSPICDLCQNGYDSDAQWPRKNHDLPDALHEADLLILATQPGCHMGYVQQIRDHYAASKPVVVVDMSDSCASGRGNVSAEGHVAYYIAIAGRPVVAYFKREVRLGEHWALPLPLSYPASRMPQIHRKDIRVFYWAADHDGTMDGPGYPRMQIAAALKELLPPNQREVRLFESRKARPTPAEYHAQMAAALVGVSWNGAPNIETFDCNRFWENFAYGLAQVSYRPTIRIPHAPVDGVHCVYVDHPYEVAPAVLRLLSEPQRALEIATAGRQHFAEFHTSEARAAYLLNLVQMVA